MSMDSAFNMSLEIDKHNITVEFVGYHSRNTMYRIAGNFRQGKFSPISPLA